MAAVVCQGDSITQATGNAEPYPQRLCFLLPASFTVYNLGITGQTTANALTNYTSGVQGKGFKYVVVLSGINDIRLGNTGASAFANLKSIYDACLADTACSPVLITVFPASTSSGWVGAMQTQLDALNTSIRSYAITNSVPIWDGYADMGQPGTPTVLATAYASGDGLHPSQAGFNFMAQQVNAVIRAAEGL